MDELEYRRLLKALPVSVEPDRDLFPGIAARLDPRPASVRASMRPAFPFAVAAGFLAVALGVGWLALRGVPGHALADGPARTPPLLREAQAMRAEYTAAWAAGGAPLQARLRAQADPGLASALTELDAAESELRSALAIDPDARFLFNRLKQVQDQRLQLTRKALSA